MAELQPVFWIDDVETLNLLTDPLRMELIELLYHPQSVTELAEKLGVPRTRLYHHVGMLESAGLVKIVDTRQVGAIPERVYQVAAESFQPSAEFLQSAAPRAQAEAVVSSIFGVTRADFMRSVEDGRADLSQHSQQRSIGVIRRMLKLSRGQLHQLIDEIEELVGNYPETDNADAIPVAVVSLVYPSSRTL